MTTSGRPLAGTLVELWHTNAAGEYPPLRASRRTSGRGEFTIQTVLPGHNRGYRARHIHFLISHPQFDRLVTRIYFKGDENMDEAPWPELAIVPERGELNGHKAWFATVEFILGSR